MAEEVLAALVGGDEAEPAGFQRPATPVLRSPRGGGDDPHPPRARERDRLRDLPRGEIGSGCVRGGRRGTRAAAARGASSRRSSPSPRGASLSRGLSWGLAMVVQPWGAEDLRGVEHTWRPRSGGGAGGRFSLFSFLSTDRPGFPQSQTVQTPGHGDQLSDQRSAQTQTKFKLSPRLLGAHRWASRAARFGGRTPRCGSAASPRAR